MQMTNILKERIKRVHFIAIGGIGMSGIAEMLLTLGFQVSGSDVKESDATRRLRSLGATIYIGHKAEQALGADVVVYSSAIKMGNPEIMQAQALKIPLIPRAEMLSELMRMKVGIAVAGSHGKTTVTSMEACILAEAGLDPTFAVGGKITSMATHVRLGEGEYFVVEADESDGSFLKFSPVISLVTNIDAEHLDYYHDVENVKGAFLAFINKVPFYGTSVLCVDDPNVRSCLSKVVRPFVTYGLSHEAGYNASNVRTEGMKTRFIVSENGQPMQEITLNMPGAHNVQNAVGAIALARQLNVDYSVIGSALASFKGIHRRFELRGEKSGVMVFDDYAHHPSEIRAALATAKSALEGRRVIVVFQPHRYSRVRDSFNDFAESFQDADALICAEIYAASEQPIPGISGRALFEKIAEKRSNCFFFEDRKQIVDFLASECKSGDAVITVGAGDVNQTCKELLERL